MNFPKVFKKTTPKPKPEKNILLEFSKTLYFFPECRFLLFFVRVQKEKEVKEKVNTFLNLTATASFLALGSWNPLWGGG